MKGFGKNLRVVTSIHLVVVLALFIISGCRKLFTRKPPQVIPIEFTVEVPGEPMIEPVPAPLPDPDSIPVPSLPTSRPKPPRRRIETSSQRVIRNSGRERQARLTEKEIEKLLAEGARPSDKTQIPDADARGFARVRAAFYELWVQPSRTEVGDQSAEAVISLGTGGRVISSRLSGPSGNAVLDNSVRRALNAVKQITGLPNGFVERHREISVAFRVE